MDGEAAGGDPGTHRPPAGSDPPGHPGDIDVAGPTGPTGARPGVPGAPGGPGAPGAPADLAEGGAVWRAGATTAEHVAAIVHHHVLDDGTRVLIRPLLPTDRAALAAGYEQLSPTSRRLRFFIPPERLSEADLDELTQLDYHDHFAWVAFAEDDPDLPGIGVARYVRDPEVPEAAEVAVTVLDAYQHRGLGTLLLRHLADTAVENGLHTFVNYVLWENAGAVAGLVDEGARLTTAEPGVARLEIDLPTPLDGLDDGFVHHLLHAFAEYVREVLAHLPSGLPRSP